MGQYYGFCNVYQPVVLFKCITKMHSNGVNNATTNQEVKIIILKYKKTPFLEITQNIIWYRYFCSGTVLGHCKKNHPEGRSGGCVV